MIWLTWYYDDQNTIFYGTNFHLNIFYDKILEDYTNMLGCHNLKNELVLVFLISPDLDDIKFRNIVMELLKK